jgi:adenylate cyclase
MLAGWFALTVQLFQLGWWSPLLGVIGPALLATGTMSALRYLLEEREKRFLHDTFKTYLSPVLIEQMIESGDPPRLGGEERVISAFFSDIQAFSTFSEAIGSPSRLVELLNEYLNSLTNILEENAGTLDKYIGDAIVAMFGAPLRVDDHARRAVETAVAMQERLAILRAGWQNQGEAWPEIVHHMRMRIGLNTGPAVTGNMGSQLRMNYTMMGDTVNLAARLESGAKHYGAYILATDAIVKGAGPGFAFRELDTVQVVGRIEPVVIHEVLGRDSDPGLVAIQESFAAARRHYLDGDFAAALDGFRLSLEHEPLRGQPGVKTTPSEVFIERCETYLRNPPKQWSGIHVSTEK